MTTYYDILDVDVDADIESIRRAYRHKAVELHPDVNPSPDATEQMQMLNAAYDVLKNPDTRAKYNSTIKIEKHTKTVYNTYRPEPETVDDYSYYDDPYYNYNKCSNRYGGDDQKRRLILDTYRNYNLVRGNNEGFKINEMYDARVSRDLSMLYYYGFSDNVIVNRANEVIHRLNEEIAYTKNWVWRSNKKQAKSIIREKKAKICAYNEIITDGYNGVITSHDKEIKSKRNKKWWK